jgi:methyl-accepting chemotaxis protein
MAISFQNRIIISIFGAGMVSAVAAVVVSAGSVADMGEGDLADKSRAILSRLEVTRDYVAKQGTLDDVIKDMVQLHKDGNLSSDDKLKVLRSVPIFAAMEVGRQGSEHEGYRFRIFAENARSKDNAPNGAELKMLNRFKTEPNLKEIIEKSEDGQYLIVARPVHLSADQGCLNCHGDPAKSPFKNGKDVLGYQMENWSDGRLHGAFAIISSLGPVQAETRAAVGSIVLWSGIFTFVAAVLGFLLVRGPIASIMTITQRLRDTGTEVTKAAGEVSKGATSLANSAEQQSTALVQTSSSVAEITSMVAKSADNTRSAYEVSGSSEKHAVDGKSAVEEMMRSISKIDESNHRIATQVEDGNKQMSEIVTIIEQIGEKTKVINEIVFQTKLLSFNASVEAARAGEHGKGFAVVAEEVGNLAQMSGNAAKEISDMLSNSRSHVENLVKDTRNKVSTLIDESKEIVQQGVEVAHHCNDVLTKIVDGAQTVSRYVSEVSAASEEQSNGIAQISQAVSELDQAARANKEASDQSAQSSEMLMGQAHQLDEIVENLSGIITGAVTAPPGKLIHMDHHKAAKSFKAGKGSKAA